MRKKILRWGVLEIEGEEGALATEQEVARTGKKIPTNDG
jgi:hypothetical protein